MENENKNAAAKIGELEKTCMMLEDEKNDLQTSLLQINKEESALRGLMERKKMLRESRIREEKELRESLALLKETLEGK